MSQNAVELIHSGKGLAEVIRSIAPTPDPLTRADRPAKIPTKVVLTPEQIKAVRAFAKAVEGGVTPETRRTLTSAEIASLLQERSVLDEVEKVIKARKEAQRIAVFNHHDVMLEEQGKAEGVEVTDDGWYVSIGSAAPEGSTTGFLRSVSEGSPSLTADALREMIGVPLNDEGDCLTEEDYEASVARVDVIDELRLMLLMRSRPAVIEAVRRAVKVGRRTVTHRIGKVKS